MTLYGRSRTILAVDTNIIIMQTPSLNIHDRREKYWTTSLKHGPAMKWYFSFVHVWNWSYSWWRHQMEIFSALLALCVGNSPVTGEFPTQRPVRRSFDVFFDLRLIKRLNKQSRGWWLETLSRPLWRHCDVKMRCESRRFETHRGTHNT